MMIETNKMPPILGHKPFVPIVEPVFDRNEAFSITNEHLDECLLRKGKLC